MPTFSVPLSASAANPDSATHDVDSPGIPFDLATALTVEPHENGELSLVFRRQDGQPIDVSTGVLTVASGAVLPMRLATGGETAGSLVLRAAIVAGSPIGELGASTEPVLTVTDEPSGQEASASGAEPVGVANLTWGQQIDTTWRFDRLGNYVVELTAAAEDNSDPDSTPQTMVRTGVQRFEVRVAPSDEPPPSEPTPSESIPSETTRPETSAPPEMPGADDGGGSAGVDGAREKVVIQSDGDTPSSFVPPGEAGTSSEALATGFRIIDDGDVRIAARFEGDRLQVGLLDMDLGAATWVDPATTVLALPHRDIRWPGADANPEARAGWRKVIPEGTLAWRSTASDADDSPNGVRLAFEGGLLGEEQAPLGSRFSVASVDTDSAGWLRMYSISGAVPNLWWDGRWGSRQAWLTRSPSTTGTVGEALAAGVAVSQAGRYCLTIDVVVPRAPGTKAPEETVEGAARAPEVLGRTVLTLVAGDPTGVAPCGVPQGAGQREHPANTDTVLSQGDIRIGARMVGDALDLGLLDVSEADPRWRDAATTVLSVPHRDVTWPGGSDRAASHHPLWRAIDPEGELMWRTSGLDQPDPLALRTNGLALSLDAGYTDARRVVGGVTMGLNALESTSDGYLVSYRTTRADYQPRVGEFPIWDSRIPTSPGIVVDPGDGVSPHPQAQPAGLLLSRPGVYCATLTASAKVDGAPQQVAATFTVVVGESLDPAQVKPCAQREPVAPPDPEDPGGPDDIVLLDRGHIDVGLEPKGDAGLGLMVHSDNHDASFDFADVVLVGNTPYNRSIVPEGDNVRWLGEPGDELWTFPVSGAYRHHTLWPGLSAQTAGLHVSGKIAWSLLGARGPGDVSVYEMAALNGDTDRVFFSTRKGLPDAWMTESSHDHPAWAFSEPGVYCLTVQVAWDDRETGRRHHDRGQLTVAMGDEVDPDTVVPCERTGEPTPVAPLRPLLVPDDSSTPTLVTDGNLDLIPVPDGDGLDLALTYRRGVADPLAVHDPGNSVISTSAKVGSQWRLGWWTDGRSPGLSWDHRWIGDPTVATTTTIALGDVTGPGSVEIRSDAVGSSKPILTSTPSGPRQYTARAGMIEQRTWFTLSNPGVYCVPLTWSATVSGDERRSTSTVLTLVAGSTDPASPDYVDRAAVQPCDQGERNPPGPDPEDPEPPEKPEQPQPPRDPDSPSRPNATVLAAGHVDVASVVEGGQLRTLLKDDTDPAAGTVMRELDEVVWHVVPDAEKEVPSDPAFAFLGSPGEATWMLPATQDSMLLWPGWSTELIGPGVLESAVDWRLARVEGPGHFSLFEVGDFSAPTVRWNTRDGIDDSDRFAIAPEVHAHGAWAFSAPGVYCIGFDRTATVQGSGSQTVASKLAVVVGDHDPYAVDPRACFERGPGEPAPPPPGPGTPRPEGPGRTPPGPVPPAPPPGGAAATADECPSRRVIAAGHVDYVTALVDGRLASLIGEDATGRKTYVDPADVVLHLRPEAKVTLPAGFEQVGAPGATIWQVPQSQRAGLIWLGWNTEALNAGNTSGEVTWSLDSVDGPGSVKVYLSGVFGGVKEMVLTGAGSSYRIPLGVHAHGNWAFSEQGVYHLTMTQRATLADGTQQADTATLTIAVGDVDLAVAARSGPCGDGAGTRAVTAASRSTLGAARQVLPAAGSALFAADGAIPGPQAGLAPDLLDGSDHHLGSSSDTGPRPATMAAALGVLGALVWIAALVLARRWWTLRHPSRGARR